MKLFKDPPATARLCSLHFEDNCFYTTIDSGIRKLLSEAVPTIFPPLPSSYRHKTVNQAVPTIFTPLPSSCQQKKVNINFISNFITCALQRVCTLIAEIIKCLLFK